MGAIKILLYLLAAVLVFWLYAAKFKSLKTYHPDMSLTDYLINGDRFVVVP